MESIGGVVVSLEPHITGTGRRTSLALAGAEDVPSRFPQVPGHLLRPVVDDAGAQEQAVLLQEGTHLTGQADDDVRHDVGHHHVIAPADLRLQLLIRQHIAPPDGVSGAVDAVEGGVFIGHLHALLVDVAGEGVLRPQPQGGDGEDAAAAAQIQYPLTAVDGFLQRRQAQPGGGVAAGAEGESRIQDQGDAALRIGLLPLRHHNETFPDLHGLIKLLPVVLPVGVLQIVHGQQQRGVLRVRCLQL